MPDPIRPNGERRSFTLDDLRVETRGAGDDAAPVIAGHAAVFDLLSEDLGGFREKIAPGAFSATLGGDVRALFNHDPNHILGRTTANTLRLAEDSRGLAVEIDPPDTETGRAVVAALERGDVSQMSFGFRTITDEWTETESGDHIRTLKEVELFDVSPVTFPAYPQTDAAVRSLDAWRAAQDPADTPAAKAADQRRRRLGTLRAKADLAAL